MNYPDWIGHIIYLEKRHQLALMLVIALAGLISISYQAIQLKQLLGSTPTAIPSTQASVTHPKPVPKVIAAVPLFGNLVVAADEVASMNLPTTNLQLTLRGAVVESDETKSSAVIEEPGKPAQSYRIGDTLPSNATLHSVFADHVVLKRNGQLETLNFPTIGTLNIKGSADVQLNTAQPANINPINTPNAIHKGSPVTTTNVSPESIQERLQQLQQQHEQQHEQLIKPPNE